MTESSEETILVDAKQLEQIMCIQYFIVFPGDITQDSLALDPVSALFNSSSEVNAMHLVFAEKLSLMIQITNVSTQKIDGITLKTYGMVVTAFSVTDQASKVSFFEKTFLVVNISPDVVFWMLFLTLSGANIDFLKREL